MKIKEVVQRFRQVFDWTPVAVSQPVPEFYEYGDIGRQMIGYQVTVEYKHHGTRKYTFVCDTEKLCFADEKWAKRRADNFYNKIKKQVTKGR